MKQIYTLLTAALMMAGTALWSGCSNDELQDNGTAAGDETRATSFTFSLKGQGANTRAESVETLTKAEENTISTLYVALFQENNADAGASALHKIFCYDDKAAAGWDALKITNSGNTYTIASPGHIGNYIVYFIANPDKTIKTQLLDMQNNETRIPLSEFESALYTGDNTADGTLNDEGTAADAAKPAHGFTMMSKEAITLEDNTNKEITLTRLAARFDFINSAVATNEVKITKIEITQAGKKSIVSSSSTGLTEAASLATQTYGDLGTSGKWETQTDYYTTYAYENLITADEMNRTEINVYYTVGASSATENRKLTIELKENDAYIGVTRNHLYRIYLNGVSGEYKLTVNDWQEGITVTVPNKDLSIEYTAESQGKMGDYACVDADGNLYFVDGGLRAITISGTLTWASGFTPILTEAQKKQCVGIVFSNQTTDAEKADGYSRGQIMSLKNANVFSTNPGPSDRFAWKVLEGDDPTISSTDGLTEIQNISEASNDMNGYLHCKTIKENDANFTNHPALAKLAQFGVKAPNGTTGWYIPSMGQLFEMIHIIGRTTKFETYKTDDIYKSPLDYETLGLATISPVLTTMDNKMSRAGSYDMFKGRYVSSTEYRLTRQSVFNDENYDNVYLGFMNYKTDDCDIRPALSF